MNGWLCEMQIGSMPEGLLREPELRGLSAEEVYDRIAGDLRWMRRLSTLRGKGAGDILGAPLGSPRDYVDLLLRRGTARRGLSAGHGDRRPAAGARPRRYGAPARHRPAASRGRPPARRARPGDHGRLVRRPAGPARARVPHPAGRTAAVHRTGAGLPGEVTAKCGDGDVR
ncbi:hypothetical protein [Streptomyces avermitilis]|uniref:hypothetical protein n=1 Tax=Streptomyces avermitilis TaxID=33903 RepID=UPI0034E23A89